MIFITQVHLEGGQSHQHIAAVRWSTSPAGSDSESTRAAMVDFIGDGHPVHVRNGSHEVSVGVINANPPYLRTDADGVWTDNLLALPHY